MTKTALITGITGQDGSYLAEFLIKKKMDVFGLVRRISTPNLWRIEHILDKIELIDGDLTDQTSINNAVKYSEPDEVYNLAAQSFVETSWKQPVLTSEVTAMGTLRMLEAVRDFAQDSRYYQASSSEMFGNAHTNFIQNEDTPFHPKSPYAIAKLFAYWITVNYRESYNLYTSNGILFNHESPRRGIEFVTRKITDGVAKIKLGISNEIRLGNLNAKRDWGFAGDYVEAMWMLLQQNQPLDIVVSTGETHSVKEFVEEAFKFVGITNWDQYVKSDPRYFRPAELHELCGLSNATEIFNWKPKINFQQLVGLMVEADLNRIRARYGKN